MTTRFVHKSLLAVAICVGVINVSATSAFANSGTTGVTLPPTHITPPQGPPTTGVVCNQAAGTCALNGSGSGGTSGGSTVIKINNPGGNPPWHQGGGGGGWHRPAAIMGCLDQGGYPKYVWMRRVTISGITYNQDQVTCSWTPPGASNPWTLNNVMGVPYCTALNPYVDVQAELNESRSSSPLAPYYTVHAWETAFKGESMLGGGYSGGCLVRWLTPINLPPGHQTIKIVTPPTGYVWNYALTVDPQVTLPTPSFGTWHDPALTNPNAPTSFATFPHEYWGNNPLIQHVSPVNYPLVVDPTIPKTKVTGTYSAVVSYVSASVSVTNPFTGTVSTFGESLPVTFTAPYTATFSNMVVWSGADNNTNSSFNGYPVLEQPLNPVTPYMTVGTNETGSTCSPQEMANSQAVFNALPADSLAASNSGQNLPTGDGYDFTSSNLTRYGDCTITFRIPSGKGPGPNGDYPVVATGNWNVSWGLASVTVGGASGSDTYCPATSASSGGSGSTTTTTDPCQTVSWSIPSSSETSQQPPWAPSGFSASSQPLYVNVGIADAVSVPTGQLVN